jgi:hypothetical protein
MILSPAELAYVDSLGLYITEECDGCGKLLNQTVRYTITQKPEVDCSAECRDFAFFGDRREVSKHAGKRRCANCGGSLQTKKRGAVYWDDVCRKRPTRTGVPRDPTNPGLDREVIEVAGWRGPLGLRFSYGAYRRAELKLCASLRNARWPFWGVAVIRHMSPSNFWHDSLPEISFPKAATVQVLCTRGERLIKTSADLSTPG